jgi:hypothetical protein
VVKLLLLPIEAFVTPKSCGKQRAIITARQYLLPFVVSREPSAAILPAM